jgi:hypothetical protein
MAEQILQIIPTPPNSSDGIGDYAFLLASQLLKDAQINTQFLVFRNDIEVAPVIDEFSVARLPIYLPENLDSFIPEGVRAIVVHFSGYPYFDTSLKGMLGFRTPFWLVNVLQSIQQSRNIKLIVMFHELPKLYWKQFYLFGSLNPIHSIVSRRLAQIADTVLTTSAKYQNILTQWVKKPVLRLPIFSNMGEPELIPPLVERKRRLVVFGGAARQRVYQNAAKELIEACHSLGIEEICDIGPSLKLEVTYHFNGISLTEMGFQAKETISKLLLTSIAGCLDYTPFPGDLSKSGVFAAYCAHGMVPINTRYNPSESDGLNRNQHYLVLDHKLKNWNLVNLQTVADNARNWYQSHSLKEVSKTFVLSIRNNV